MVARKSRRSKRVRRPLNLESTGTLRQLLCARLVCSVAWADEAIRAIDAGKVDLFIDADGVLRANFSDVVLAIRKSAHYPPGGLLSLMRRCPRCDKQVAVTAFTKAGGETCEECFINQAPDWAWAEWPSSPFGRVMDEIRARGIRVERF